MCALRHTRNLEDVVTSRGLEFAALRGNPQEQQQQEETKAMMESVGNIYSYMRPAMHLHLSYMHDLLVDSWLACQGADAIVFAVNTLGGYHIAEKLGIPCFTFWYHPLNATSTFPHPLISARLRLGGVLNRLSYTGIEQFSGNSCGQCSTDGDRKHWACRPCRSQTVRLSRSPAHADGGCPSCTGIAHRLRQARAIGNLGSASRASGSSIVPAAGSRPLLWLNF